MTDGATPPPAQPRRIVFFGDSTCVGQGVSLSRGWVSRVAAHLDTLGLCGSDVILVNASVNGSTTRQALERMPYDVQSHGIALLLVQFGMNDCNYWLTDRGLPRVSPPAFAANLEEIVTRGLHFGAHQVFINTNHPTVRDTDILPYTETTYEASNRFYNTIIREVATHFERCVVLNDVERAFDAATSGDRELRRRLLLGDGLHLSERGHEIYFDLIMPRLADALATSVAAAG
jgi:lysophospholipase L1-like esterase